MLPPVSEVDCVETTFTKAVVAADATAVIDAVMLQIYAGRFALMLAGFAVLAFPCIYNRNERGETGEKTECRA